MAVRLAGPEDYDKLVTRLKRSRPNPLLAWVLDPAPDLLAARTAYFRWLVAGLLRVEHIWLGDDGSMAGGRRIRLRFVDQLRAPHPAHGELKVRRGDFSFPDVPAECQRRMLKLAAESLELRTSGRRAFLVQISPDSFDGVRGEALGELVQHAQRIRHSCLAVTAGNAYTAELEQAGFTRGREHEPGPRTVPL